MTLHVAFLWHMHQPDYVEPSTGVALLPWVRLHAAKGYLDMIAMAERFAELRISFNLTGVLVRQIEQLVRGDIRDQWRDWAARPAAELDEATKSKILEHFFSAPAGTMILPHPRYAELWYRRGTSFAGPPSAAMLSGWNENDWRDLQVWQNLAWFGYTARREFPEIEELFRKKRNFSETDKAVILRIQQQILADLLPRYKRLADAERVELTTTPFYHPILPLLLDTEYARRCMPGAALPPRFAWPEDAHEQLTRAVQQHQRVFGRRPRGLWPAEGAVSPEILPLLAEQGIEWFATDQEILSRSLEDRSAAALEPYQVEIGGAKAYAIFREHDLSDYIGFVAARNPPQIAAEGFWSKLEAIRHKSDTARSRAALVTIILDGENPWNYFPDGGEGFLESLYGKLCKSAEISTSTVSAHLAKHPPERKLTRLHSGSWINADFDIWIGDPEENRAWELLGEARRFWQQKRETGADPARLDSAKQSLLAAEGSDWFWWYGPDFSVKEDLILDYLFRAHLQNVYHALGADPPRSLETPICRAQVASIIEMPRGFLSPVVDGRVTTFYEWKEAGRLAAQPTGEGAMARARHAIETVFFGFDREKIFLRVDFPHNLEPTDFALRFCFVHPETIALEVRGFSSSKSLQTNLVNLRQPRESLAACPGAKAMHDQILEIEAPLHALGLGAAQEAKFYVQLFQSGILLEQHPQNGLIRIVLQGNESWLTEWQV